MTFMRARSSTYLPGADTPSANVSWPSGVNALTLSMLAAIVGIINVTPDSFSDGGRWLDVEAAVAHGLEESSTAASSSQPWIDSIRGTSST